MLLIIHSACIRAKLLQSCLTLCDAMDCSPLGSSIHGTFQARLQEWVAIPFSCCILTHHKGLHAFPL